MPDLLPPSAETAELGTIPGADPPRLWAAEISLRGPALCLASRSRCVQVHGEVFCKAVEQLRACFGFFLFSSCFLFLM